jgi:DNA-binding transcriptional MerR regulator
VDIGEVARRTGFSASTLRFYEEKGLISSTGSRDLRRIFDPNVLERLALIVLGWAAGLSLDEIPGVLTTEKRLHIGRGALLAKAEELGKTISNLKQMREGLLHPATCQAPNLMERPASRRILRVATSKPIGTRRTQSRMDTKFTRKGKNSNREV